MFLSTMTYEQIYQGILNDAPDLFAAITKQLPDFRKYAKRAKNPPYGRIYSWTHPVSKNKYIYFFNINRHSDWDKTPRLIIITQYDDTYGKTTIEIARDPNGNIRISIFKYHFFKRYFERNLANFEEITFDTAHDIIMAFLLRTSSTISLGSKLASLKEQEKNDPDLIDDALLTTEGVLQCKIYRKNPNIVLFKTYLSVQDLFSGQYEEVTKNAIHVFYLRASNDSPRYQKSIDKIYLEGIEELNRLWLDPTLPLEEKQKLRMKKYGTIIDEFYKYII